MFNADSQTRENRLLAALPDEEYQRLLPHLEYISLTSEQIIYNPGEAYSHVYFPLEALISLTILMEDGSTVEVGVVNHEGMLGLPVCWGGNSTTTQAIVQISGSAVRMDAQLLKVEFARGGTLQRLLLLYTQALFTQVSQTAACNRLHKIEQRLARWLLTVHDRIQSQEIPLTQEFIAIMLGIRRAGVTEAAGNLQRAGAIRYSRGKIEIVNRDSLEVLACECYGIIKREFARLLSTNAS